VSNSATLKSASRMKW